MTLSAWIKCSIQAGYGAYIFKGNGDAVTVNGWDYSVFPNAVPYQQGSGQIFGQAGGDYSFIDSQLTSVNGSWHHVVVTFGGAASTKIYTDRVLDTNPIVFSPGAFASLRTSTNGLRFGSQIINSVPTTFYTGLLNNVSLWNVTMNQSQINELASAGKPADLSTHSLYATNCASWYKCGDGDSIAANGILDSTTNALHMSPTNMDASNIVSDAP